MQAIAMDRRKSRRQLKSPWDASSGYVADLEPATPIDLAEYRRVRSDPRENLCEHEYQRIMRLMMDEPLLEAGLRMAMPEEPGETWRDREPALHLSPIGLPDEVLTARQYAAEWWLLWGEAVAWASKQIEPREVEIDPDHDFVRALTGNYPSKSVAYWCNTILSKDGKFKRIRDRF